MTDSAENPVDAPGSSLHGGARGFPTTHWSVVAGAGDRTRGDWRAHLETLALTYWRPIYGYIRRSRRAQAEDAKDLTQSFFLHMLEGEMLEDVRPEGPRFRTYLKACLEFFLRKAHRDAARLKRGGGHRGHSLDRLDYAAVEAMTEEDGGPEETLDRQWRRAVLDEATDRLLRSYELEGRPTYAEAFRSYALPEPATERPTYAALAARLGVSERDVGNYLTHARQRLREMVREVVAESVSTPEALESEFRELFQR